MLLTLDRIDCTDERTIGRLSVEQAFECWTLEDAVRQGPKIHGRTAIPAGVYRVIVSWSPRFKRELPMLEMVPGFEGIRIHPGNTAEDTEGCILVGQRRGASAIYDSRIAFDALFDKIKQAERVDGCWIQIRNAPQETAETSG